MQIGYCVDLSVLISARMMSCVKTVSCFLWGVAYQLWKNMRSQDSQIPCCLIHCGLDWFSWIGTASRDLQNPVEALYGTFRLSCVITDPRRLRLYCSVHWEEEKMSSTKSNSYTKALCCQVNLPVSQQYWKM